MDTKIDKFWTSFGTILEPILKPKIHQKINQKWDPFWNALLRISDLAGKPKRQKRESGGKGTVAGSILSLRKGGI